MLSIVVGPVVGPRREAVVVLLLDSVGGGEPGARRAAAGCLLGEGVVLTALWAGEPVAAACVVVAGQAGRLTALAVGAPWRGRGIGRSVVEAAVIRLGLASLEAETDRDAVGFYAACGFTVVSLGERYSGVERFAVSRGSQ